MVTVDPLRGPLTTSTTGCSGRSPSTRARASTGASRVVSSSSSDSRSPLRVYPGARPDAMVVNNTRVLPARLFGTRVREGVVSPEGPPHVEVLLARQRSNATAVWDALVKPGKRVKAGDRLVFEGLEARVTGVGERGLRTIEFPVGADLFAALDRIGHVPLPPYMRRTDDEADRERYQTVFAHEPGSVAAPTAGLHFTPRVLAALEDKGVERVEVRLDVGLGTFQPLNAERVEDVELHVESYVVSEEAARRLNGPGTTLAVGTTSVRTLEAAARVGKGSVAAGRGETRLFISPGFEFQVVDRLLTNFHLPESSLLMLVCAFAGTELVLEAYRHAVREGYRFYSYGDCMLVV